jgi:hypothetical protein
MKYYYSRVYGTDGLTQITTLDIDNKMNVIYGGFGYYASQLGGNCVSGYCAIVGYIDALGEIQWNISFVGSFNQVYGLQFTLDY